MTTLLSAAVRATSGHDDRFLFLSGSQITYLQLFGELVKIFVPLKLLDDMSTAIQGTSEDDIFLFLSCCWITCLLLFKERVKMVADLCSSHTVG